MTQERAKKPPTFTLRGERITSYEAFMDEFAAVLCPGFSGFGRNLDAVVDVLRGGMGNYPYGEQVRVVWSNFHRSAAFARKDKVLKVLAEVPNVTFERG